MKYVLFVCTHNAGRSQIAQALFERYAPDDFRAESAGEEPATAIWPNVVEVMREIGIDIAGRRPKKLEVRGNQVPGGDPSLRRCHPRRLRRGAGALVHPHARAPTDA
jgi:Low molecular weight phosphotyrosine protein phosphatase